MLGSAGTGIERCGRLIRKLLFSIDVASGQGYHYACRQTWGLGLSRRNSVSGLWLTLIAIVAGAALALGATFAVTGALAGANDSPVNQQLYNYGSR
jgi:hypothetical protein